MSDSPRKTAVVCLLIGVCAGFLEYVTHTTILHSRISRPVTAIGDSCVVGVAFAALGWFLFSATRSRRQRVLEQVRIVAELNHQVRNALQIIVDSQYKADPQQAALVMDSVKRIDTTLHELFPVIGERGEDHKQHLVRVGRAGLTAYAPRRTNESSEPDSRQARKA